MLQICSACVKQFEINFFNPMTTLELSRSCAQRRRKARSWRGHCPPCLSKRVLLSQQYHYHYHREFHG